MSGFSAEWLALREGADHRARNRTIMKAVSEHFADCREVAVIDLGCGTGSNLRAAAMSLPAQQRWTLVDHDTALLVEAKKALSAWADDAADDAHELVLRRGSYHIAVSFLQCDLMKEPERPLSVPADLVTAAALFDLVSQSWIKRFVALLSARRLPLYAALTYNGEERWAPPHESDARMLAAYHAHQHTDKGFGPAAGPSAARILQVELEQAGYRVRTGDSAWHLGSVDGRLVSELAKGIASAVGETGAVPDGEVAAWLSARLAGVSCAIGHTDLWAIP